jgi:argininosuccinate lyase
MTEGQLWSKALPLDELVHRFTVGDDHILDLHLLPWDFLGTAAHVRMLSSVKLLDEQSCTAILQGLAELDTLHKTSQFRISSEQEDCHTAIEQYLTKKLGAQAGNVHLGRSRNDQVLTAQRLFMKDALLQCMDVAAELAIAFCTFAQSHAAVPMPGYTHLRRAMPSSIAQWALAFSAGLQEELQVAEGLFHRLDSCPLGSGAGFGLPLPLDRELSAKLLGFGRVQQNAVDCANSRGRHELALAGWISEVGNVLEKFIWDACLYSTEEFGFISLSDAFTTGSSIMPQKRNPDVLELARGRCAQLRAWRNELEQIHTGLPSNYHRDYQLLKPALFRSIAALPELLSVLIHILPGIVVNADRLQATCTPELHAAKEAYRRVRSGGITFRDAYRVVGAEILNGQFKLGEGMADENIPERGSQLETARLQSELQNLREFNRQRTELFRDTLSKLLD